MTERVGMRGTAGRVVAGQYGVTKELRREDIEQLLRTYAHFLGDAEQRDWLLTEYPQLSTWLASVPVGDLARGLVDDVAMTNLVQRIEGKIDERLEKSRWDELGLSPAYEDRFRQFGLKQFTEYIVDIEDDAGKERPRFIMDVNRYEKLMPDDSAWWQRAFSAKAKDRLKDRLKSLGVSSSEVDIGARTEVTQLGHRMQRLHIPPRDATLLLDALQLGDRANDLCPDQDWEVVRRLPRPDGTGDDNYLVMPAKTYLELRGVRAALPRGGPPPEKILEACTERLHQRGLEQPDIRLLEVDGKTAIAIPTEQARVLIAPIMKGDPACEISLRPLKEWEPAAREFRGDNAVAMAQAAILSYNSQEEIEAAARVWGFDQVTFIEDRETDAQGFVAYHPEANTVLVAFRGTSSFQDFLVDANVSKVSAGAYGRGKVHAGMVGQMNAILGDVEGEVVRMSDGRTPPPHVMTCGHSLGGALAMLYTAHRLAEGKEVTSTYTFGQPKVGDDAFVESLQRQLDESGTGYFRFVNNSDLIARVPPGFAHGAAGVELYFDHKGQLVDQERLATIDRLDDMRADGGDGIADHGSANYLGLCRKNCDCKV